MLDNMGGIPARFTSNFSASAHSKAPDKITPAPDPIMAADIFKSESSSTPAAQEYVIIPPKAQKEIASKGAVYKASERQLKKMKVSVKEKLPLIGGYVAKLDDDSKGKLTDAGYFIFKDDVKNWLPKDPTLEALKDADGNIDIDEVPKELKDRPKMDGPRFVGTLTKQYTGKGVTIAVIDTGIYPHPDLTYPRNRIKGFVDFVNGKRIPYDDGGHGTHVAGDAAGSGMMSKGLYKGSAPDASLIGLKALAGKGGGKTSDVIKAITWAIQNKDKYNIRVINMSLGHTASEDYWNDPTNMAVKAAYEAGIVVVAAAGNEGPGPQTVGSPGDSPHAISVGAADDGNTTKDPSDDKVTDFSSRGPTPGGLMKPDILAPGEAIIAPYSPGTEDYNRKVGKIAETMKWFAKMPDEALMRIPKDSLRLMGLSDSTVERWYQSPKQARKEIARIHNATQKSLVYEESYVAMPGTSMASPIVAGVVAQMLQANPDLTPGQVSQILKMTADKLPGDVPQTEQGHGMVDPNEAIQIALDVKEGKIEIAEPNVDWPTKAQIEAFNKEHKAEKNA